MKASLWRNELPAIMGLLPPLLWLGAQDPWLAPRFAFCALLVYGWQVVFALVRRQGIGLHGLVLAALLAILVPSTAPFWQLALGLSFGLVLGEAIFGGRGRNFVQPVVLTLAFLAFSFTDQPWRDGPDLPLSTALPAALLLIASGQARLPVLMGFGLGLAGLIWAGLPGVAVPGLLVLAVIYLTADPVVSGATLASRLAYGLLAGLLCGLFTTTGPAFGALIFATLLAQIFAPLLDHLAVAAHVAMMRRRARRLRHG